MKTSAILLLTTLVAWAHDSVSESGPKGVAPNDWAQIRAEYERHRQAAFPVAGGAHQARSYGQQWLTRFDGRRFEVTPDAATWRWGLELASYGFPGQLRQVTKAQAKADVEKFAYQWDAVMQEWFVNGRGGLEHGFTLGSRPGGTEGRGLELHLKVVGTLTPQISKDGRDVAFVDAEGQSRVHYDGLKVTDAQGQPQVARFQPEANGLLLTVDEQNAVYPLTIDPLAYTQQAYLKASNSGAFDRFGSSVGISGDTIVVGASSEDSTVNGDGSNSSATGVGAAYVFVRSGTAWSEQAYLKASNFEPGDLFGWSVGICGDTIVIGATGESSNATTVNGDGSNNSAPAAGAAYVFVRSGTAWSQQAYLKASNSGAFDWFGSSVGISEDTIVVGAVLESSNATRVNGDGTNNSASRVGAGYVFVRSGTAWNQQAYLKASNSRADNYFGESVGISGDTIVVGAYGESSNALSAGAAYVFVRSGTAWSQQAYLKASNSGAGDGFGVSVGISGETIVIGAVLEDSNATTVNGDGSNNSALDAGAAYVFVRSGTAWSQQAYLKASNSGAGDRFGASVGIGGDMIVVGAWHEASDATMVNGDGTNNSANDAGAAYVFVRSGTAWSQQAFLKASNSGASDWFGASVGISGNTIVVGARGEDSNATTVNGDGSNNSAFEAGAAYVFVLPPSSTVNVTVNSSPTGRLFSSTGTGCAPGLSYTASQVLSWTPGSSCIVAFDTPQAGAAGTQYVFAQWENAATNATRAITAPAVATTYTATFKTQHRLTTAVAGPGTVSPATGFQDAGMPVNVSATPGCGIFTGWSGATVTAGQVTLTAPVTLTANFAASPVAVTAVKGSLLTVRGTPIRYRQNVSALNTTGAEADVTIIVDTLGAGVSVLAPASPTGTTTSCTGTVGRNFYTVTGVAPGAFGTVTFDFAAPSAVGVTYNASAVLGSGPR